MFIRVCAWCKALLAITLDKTFTHEDQISHGICPACSERMKKEFISYCLKKGIDPAVTLN